MKQKQFVSVVMALCLLPFMSLTVYANSSWHWFTRDPLPILPWAIVGTFIIEIFIICRINHIIKVLKAVAVIISGNVISFLTPYIFVGITPDIFEENANFFARIENMASKLPFYIVNIAFLALTLIIEVPIVYLGLKNNAKDKKRLLFSIIIANIITTIIVALIERILYKGSW